MSTSVTLTTISNNPVDAIEALNTPIGEVQAHLNNLYEGLEAVSNRHAIIYSGAPLDSEVVKGNIVYFNKTTSRFTKALAALSDETGADGSPIEAESAHAEGLVLEVDETEDAQNNVVGTILLCGQYTDPSVIEGFLGSTEEAAAGLYCLSTETAGTVMPDPGTGLRIPVLSYYGSGTFAFNTMSVFNTCPLTDNQGVVRSIESTNSLLSVRNVNGHVTLNPSSYINGGVYRNPVAVSSLTENRIVYTPVLTGIAGGPGMEVSVNTSGVAMVSSTYKLGLLDAYSVNHNQTNVTSDSSGLCYITFPKGRASSIIITLPVNGIPSSTSLSAKVWCMGTGQGNLGASFNWISDATASSNSVIGGSSSSGSVVFSGSDNSIGYGETGDSISFSGSGMLTATLSRSSSNDDLNLLRVGFKLSLNNAATSMADTQHITSMISVSNNAGCVSGVTAYKCVMATENGLNICASTNVSNINKCVGVSVTSATSDGNGAYACDYMIQGVITNSSWDYTPGLPLFIGTGGELTQTDPVGVSGAKFVQAIGQALSATTVQINIMPGILK